LNVCCTRQEVVEVIVQIAVYGEFPAAFNGFVSSERGLKERDASGKSGSVPRFL
jgi:4-carboxymuconolactone decarboxylase